MDHSPPDSVNSLWYDPFINRFEDEDGKILHTLHQYFNTWQLDTWKKTKEYGLLVDKNGDIWELFYNLTNKHRHCGHFCSICISRCEIYTFVRDWEKERRY